MQKKLIATFAAVMLSAPFGHAAETNSIGDVKITADAISVEGNDTVSAKGNVRIFQGDTEVKAETATITVKDGKTVIEADAVEVE